jgi:predicted RNA binding protein YcfA (HicA-like mRNA interferase family)
MKYSEFYKLIEADGWIIKGGTRHYKYVHPFKKGFIPVARHRSQEIPDGTFQRMMKVAALIEQKNKRNNL